MKDQKEPKRSPLPEDFDTAQRNNPNWDTLTTRKKNMLAKDETYHREYRDLAEEIMGVRK